MKSTSDLTDFAKEFLPASAADASFTLVEINGGLNTQSDPGTEYTILVLYLVPYSPE